MIVMREHVIQTERQHERRVKVCKEPFVINTSYDAIKNKPQINSVVVENNKSFEEYGIHALTNSELEEMLV